MMNKKVQILDCTLRDGGLGLEDADRCGLDTIKFAEWDRADIARHLTNADIDIVELGSIEITCDDRTGYCIYPDIQSISRKIPQRHNERQLFAALYRGPDTPIKDIPEWHPGLCEAVRVIIRYSEMQKSLDFCAVLSAKGYKVFVQPMVTMRYSEEEIHALISQSNMMNAYALYIVDSYGYMLPSDVYRLFQVYDEELSPGVRIGFHAHNNMSMAFANVLSFINIETDRGIIVDSCLQGMGQGAGNLQTELLVGYINGLAADYNYSEILDACEIVEKFNKNNLWGYSVTRSLPAIHHMAYKYAAALRNQYGMSYKEMDRILSTTPSHMTQRYTKENLEELLMMAGYENLHTNNGMVL